MGSVRRLLIGNQWRQSATRAQVFNPFNGTVVAEVCQAELAEAEQALQKAAAAFLVMRHLPTYARARALGKIAQGLLARQEEFARLITAEAGKPIAGARREVDRSVQTFRLAAVLANEILTFRAEHMPYGGVKDSGIGREGVPYAIEEMMDVKLLVLNIHE